MPPIRQLDEAFLSQLLEPNNSIHNNVLKTNISSDSLTSILTKLTTTSNTLQQELFKQVHDNFNDFSSLYNESQDLHSCVFDLVQSVSETSDQVDSTDKKVSATINAYQQALRDSQLNQNKIESLERLEDTLYIIASIETELQQCNYLDAVKHVTKLIEILNQPRDEANKTVVGFIQKRVDSLKQTLITQLQEATGIAIQYNLGSIRILETFQMNGNTVHISQIFQCFHQLGLLPEELMSVQRLIFKNILNPYFEDIYSVLQINHVNVDNVGCGGVLQVIHHESASSEEIHYMDPVIMLQHMESTLGFFYRYMFDKASNTQIRHLFGNLLLPDLFNVMITKSITPAIPSSKEQLPAFDLVVQAVAQFENQCQHYGYIIDKETTLLSTFVDNIDQHYAKKRRERILQQGRKVMVRRLYDTDVTQVHDTNGHTYHYQITQTPQILLVLISDTLAEAMDLLESHPISASSLVHGIKDLLDMYRAIMPSYHRTQYLSTAANALVFRNDCAWLSHQLNTDIAAKSDAVRHFEYLNKDLKESAQRFADLGQAWYELAMMQRVQMIKHILDTLDGFTGMADNSIFQQDCDRAVTRVIQCVLTFASETRPVVDETLFLDMLGRIVDSVLVRLIHDIEELIDIGAEESHIIAVTLNSLAQLVGAFDLPGQDATESFVLELVPSWQKFWLVKDILEMNMREIMESFRRGDLHMFEKSELIGLLSALFAETELRESNIQEIKTGRSASKPPVTTTMSTTRETIPPKPMTRTSSIPTSLESKKSSMSTGLTYTPDEEDMEESGAGWGDDESDGDLFTSNTIPSIQNTPLSLALSPDHDIEQEAESGWNDDNDDDLFSEDNHKHSSSSLALAVSPEEGLFDEQDSGWGDADEDIFVDDALQQNDSNMPEPNDPKNAVPSAANTDKVDREMSIRQQPPNLAADIPKTTKLTTTALSAPALDDHVNEEGWGWDDDDEEDLFKVNQDLN